MSVRHILICLLILSIAAPAAAETSRTRRAQHWQMSLQTRYTPAKDYSGDNGSALEIEDDLGWGFGFSYNLTPKLNLGAGFNWRSIPYVATVVDADDPGVTERLPSDFDVTVMELRAHYFVTETTLAPYVNGSWGWMLIDSNIQAGTQVGCWWYPYWGYVCDVYAQNYGLTTWTAGLGAGVRWEPGRDGNFFINGGYEYGWTGSDLLENNHIFKLEFGLLL